MIAKLRKQIILVNMILMGVALLIILGLFGMNASDNKMDDIKSDMSRYIGYVSETERELSFISTESSTFYMLQEPINVTPTSTVALNSNNTIVRVYNDGVTLSMTSLEGLVEQALSARDSVLMEIPEENLFYLVHRTHQGTFISFAYSYNYHDYMTSTLQSLIILYIIIMIFFFVLSNVMARLAVAPVKRSWERQHQFIADASHELKTPLTVMLANNNILMDSDVDEDARKWIESNDDEARHMQVLVERLLFLARKDSGRQKLLMQEVSLTDMLMENVLTFEPVAFERGILIDVDCDFENEAKIYGDYTMINQLIHILLDNACKYAEENSTIDTHLRKTKKHIFLSVHNTGAPIPAEDLPHIFERFYRSDKSRTSNTQAKGYGLGLAIAKSIAKDHDGTITATSNAKEGTTFEVRFRLPKELA